MSLFPMQCAAIPLIVFLPALLAGAWWWWRWRVTATKGKKMVVLGMLGAGKTTLHYYLRGIKKSIQATSREDLEKTKVQIGEKTVTFAKTVDIAGGEEFVEEYKALIQKNDVCVFLFDISEYSKAAEYFRQTNGRLQFIAAEIMQKKNVEFRLLGTHKRKLTLRKQLTVNWCNAEISSDIRDLFTKGQFSLIEMQDEAELKKLKETLFK